MSHYSHLFVFFLLLLGIIVLPGADMAFVVGKAVIGGRRSGFAALGGIIMAGWVHVTFGALGISVILRLYPSVFRVLLVLGAGYIAWIGTSLIFNKRASESPVAEKAEPLRWSTVAQGAVTALLNPKAYLFTLAVFPQFIRPEYGAIWTQAVVLGAMITLTQFAVYGALVVVAAQARQWRASATTTTLRISRSVGAILIIVAVLGVLQGWRTL